MNLIPRCDLASLYAPLPAELKRELHLWFQFAQAIDACGQSASSRNAHIVNSFAAKLSCSPANIRRKLTEWRRTKDWRVFVNRAKAGSHWWRSDASRSTLHADPALAHGGSALAPALSLSPALPKEFITHLRSIFCANQRKCKPAYRALLRQWSAWLSESSLITSPLITDHSPNKIPGYQTCPPPGPNGKHPVGWSYNNLIRYRPDDYKLKAGRIGRAAASDLRLQVFTSRVGLKVGQYIQLDDHEFNFKVNFTGQTKAMRPRMLGALDVFSGCDFCHGFKPTLWNEALQKKEVLREIDTMWLVVAILTRFGYRTDRALNTSPLNTSPLITSPLNTSPLITSPLITDHSPSDTLPPSTILVVEWGTAAIRSDFEARIRSCTNGHVAIERSGKFGRASFTGLFEGAVKGNYRFKASRESFFNLLDNELASLPAQVGKDRDHTPEENVGLERYNEKLLRAAQFLDPDRAAKLLFPCLEWNQALDLLLTAFHHINTRTDHELEGWERAGLIAHEFRLSARSALDCASPLALSDPPRSTLHAPLSTLHDQWLCASTFAALDDHQRAALSPLLETRVRKLSPMEVFQRGATELTVLPRCLYPDLVGLEHGRLLAVRNGLFEFKDQELSPDTLRYRAPETLDLKPETHYLCFVNPFDPAVLVACTPAGGFVAECPIWDAPSRSDHDAIKKKLGQAKQWEAEALAQLGLLNTDRARARAAMHAHNAHILGHSPVKPEPAKSKHLFDSVAEVHVTDQMLSASTQPDLEP